MPKLHPAESVVIDHHWAENEWQVFYSQYDTKLLNALISLPPVDVINNNCNDNNNNNNNNCNDAIESTQDADLIPIDISKASDEFKIFVGRQFPNMQMSCNQEKINALEKALDRVDADYCELIFQDANISEIALALFFHQKISLSQITTILERKQNLELYEHHQTHRILNDKGEFTDEALKFFIPTISKREYLPPLSDKELEKLKKLIAHCPASEQIFYTTHKGRLNPIGLQVQGNRLDPYYFTYQIYAFDAVFVYRPNNNSNPDDIKLVHFSCGVRDALGLARFGREYVRPVSRLGKLSIQEIDEGMRYNIRLSTVAFLGIKGHAHNAEGYVDVETPEFTAHDNLLHVNLMACTPKPFLAAFRHMIDLTRNFIPHKFSKEIWTWIDFDFNDFYRKSLYIGLDQNDLQKMTEFFWEYLFNDDKSYLLYYPIVDNKKANNKVPTIFGTIVILDMLKNPELWRDKFKIDPVIFRKFEPINRYFTQVEALLKGKGRYLEGDSPIMQLFRCHLYYVGDYHGLEKLNKAINDNKQAIESDIQIEKITSKMGYRPTLFKDENDQRSHKNMVCLTYEGDPITSKTERLLTRLTPNEILQIKTQKKLKASHEEILRSYEKVLKDVESTENPNPILIDYVHKQIDDSRNQIESIRNKIECLETSENSLQNKLNK